MLLLVLFLGSVSVALSRFAPGHGYVLDANNTLTKIYNPSINVDLSGGDILSLDPHAFANCVSVKTLDLSNNSIKVLPEDVFWPMSNLEHLSLANNDLDIKSLRGAFLGLVNLKSLNITYNPLRGIWENDTFNGLMNSCEVYVGRSKTFRTLTPFMFRKKCPDRLDDRLEMFEDERSWEFYPYIHPYATRGFIHFSNESYSDVGVKMCTDNTTVRLVDVSNVTDTRSPNCRSVLTNDNGTKVKIYDETITSFDPRWFRIRNPSVKAIYLSPKSFGNLTSDLLNDLPENVKFVSLQDSELERLRKGVMFNEHLRGLDLSANFIRFIEEDTFAGLNLTRLNLGLNQLATLDYVPTLPKTLLSLNLEFNVIDEIPVEGFSRLENLLALNLNGNELREVDPASFRGLESLQWLEITLGNSTNMPANGFEYIPMLYHIGLSGDNRSRLHAGDPEYRPCVQEMDYRSPGFSMMMRKPKSVTYEVVSNFATRIMTTHFFVLLLAGIFV